MKPTIGQAAKAIYAAVVAGSRRSGLLVNDTSLADVTAGQWVFVALSVLDAGGGVYGLRNGAPAGAGG
jgi:hypothetical protein